SLGRNGSAAVHSLSKLKKPLASPKAKWSRPTRRKSPPTLIACRPRSLDTVPLKPQDDQRLSSGGGGPKHSEPSIQPSGKAGYVTSFTKLAGNPRLPRSNRPRGSKLSS